MAKYPEEPLTRCLSKTVTNNNAIYNRIIMFDSFFNDVNYPKQPIKKTSFQDF